MKFGSTLAVLAVLGLVATSFVGAEEESKDAAKAKEEMAKILKVTKCPISGGPVKEAKFVSYKDSKVFMCCGNCVKAFTEKVKKDTTLAAKANHQLVMTKQASQKKCCINGKGPMNKDTHTKVVGVQVHTCCKTCLGKLNKMEQADQIKTVFGKNFDKAFAVKAQEKKKKDKKKAA